MPNYNTQLQSNNTDLQEVLQTLQTKAAGGDDPFASVTPFTYTVNAITNAQYGFAKNSNGYYESQNKGQNNSYAICRVNLTVTKTCDIIFDVINYAESNYDYALFSDLNKALSLSSTADSSNVKKNFEGQQSASVVNVTYTGVTTGTHFIDIKFIKDSSQHNNNDSVQFKLPEGGLSQETINKILAADSDLVASNIKSGVDIFGVTGTYVGSGDTSVEDSLVTRDVTNYTNDRITTIGYYAFYNCSKLTTVNFPVVTAIRSYAFVGCKSLTTASFPAANIIEYNAFYACISLTTASFPAATTMGDNAFYFCSGLTTVNFPIVTAIGNNAFGNCTKLTTVSFPAATIIRSSAFNACISLTTANFPAATTIGSSAFRSCWNFKSLYLMGSSICTLSNSNAFTSTPIGGYSTSAKTYGSIYVPASLVDAYKTATNWTYFSSRIVGI